jgi:hypothetical protein
MWVFKGRGDACKSPEVFGAAWRFFGSEEVNELLAIAIVVAGGDEFRDIGDFEEAGAAGGCFGLWFRAFMVGVRSHGVQELIPCSRFLNFEGGLGFCRVVASDEAIEGFHKLLGRVDLVGGFAVTDGQGNLVPDEGGLFIGNGVGHDARIGRGHAFGLFSKLNGDVECLEEVSCVFEGFGRGWGGLVLFLFEDSFSHFFPVGEFLLEFLVIALETPLGSEELFLDGLKSFLLGVL